MHLPPGAKATREVARWLCGQRRLRVPPRVLPDEDRGARREALEPGERGGSPEPGEAGRTPGPRRPRSAVLRRGWDTFPRGLRSRKASVGDPRGGPVLLTERGRARSRRRLRTPPRIPRRPLASPAAAGSGRENVPKSLFLVKTVKTEAELPFPRG